MLKQMGFTPHFQQHMEHIAEDCRNGVFAGTNDFVKTLTGQEPLGMKEYVAKNRARFG